MINKSIQSMAILKANWEHRHNDYIDTFIPLYEHLLYSKGYDTIEINTLRSDFEHEFGLAVPYHPTLTIVNRLKKSGLISRKDNCFHYNSTAHKNHSFAEIRDNQLIELKKLTGSLVTFCKVQHGYDITVSSAEQSLVSFFRESALGMLSATSEQGSLPALDTSKTTRYYIGKYIEDAKISDPSSFQMLMNLAVGAALANTIVYGQDLQYYSGKMKGLNVYLDTGIVFSLLGVNGQEKREAFEELIHIMSEMGVKFYIFDHTYDEIMRILNAALYWIGSGAYDLQKASRVLKYFIESECTETDVDVFISTVPSMLARLHVQTAEKPSYKKEIEYQIDESELKTSIIESYKSDPFFDHELKEDTIQKDIESMYSICKLRKGRVAYTLKDASHIFMTGNVSLSRISARIQSEDKTVHLIPPFVTDTLLGTLVWLQYPQRVVSFNEKKLMADAYAAVQPDPQLVRKYLESLEKLKQDGTLSEDEYHVMRTNRVAYNLLASKTHNDSENFQPRTTRDILDEINKEHMDGLKRDLEQGQKKYVETTSELDLTKQKLSESEEHNTSLSMRHEKAIRIIATTFTWLILIVMFAFLFESIYLVTFSDEFGILRASAFVIVTVVGLFGIDYFNAKSFIFEKVFAFLKLHL